MNHSYHFIYLTKTQRDIVIVFRFYEVDVTLIVFGRIGCFKSSGKQYHPVRVNKSNGIFIQISLLLVAWPGVVLLFAFDFCITRRIYCFVYYQEKYGVSGVCTIPQSLAYIYIYIYPCLRRTKSRIKQNHFWITDKKKIRAFSYRATRLLSLVLLISKESLMAPHKTPHSERRALGLNFLSSLSLLSAIMG